MIRPKHRRGFADRGWPGRRSRRRDGGEEIEEADAQEADEAVHAAEDAAVQGADPLVIEYGKVALHQVADQLPHSCWN